MDWYFRACKIKQIVDATALIQWLAEKGQGMERCRCMYIRVGWFRAISGLGARGACWGGRRGMVEQEKWGVIKWLKDSNVFDILGRVVIPYEWYVIYRFGGENFDKSCKFRWEGPKRVSQNNPKSHHEAHDPFSILIELFPSHQLIVSLCQLSFFCPQALLLVGAGVSAATRRPFFRPRSINTQALVDELTAGIPLSDLERRALYKLVEPPSKERGW